MSRIKFFAGDGRALDLTGYDVPGFDETFFMLPFIYGADLCHLSKAKEPVLGFG